MATNTLHTDQQPQTHGATTKIVEHQISRENRRFKMLCSRCVLPFLALYLLLEQISAAALPSRFKNKREVNWLDQEVFSRLSDRSDGSDLSVGDAAEMSRDTDSHLINPIQQQQQHQNQNNRKANEKRRKVAPMDSIGRFQMSSFRHRKDGPDVKRKDNMD